jgi:hypothetical protein
VSSTPQDDGQVVIGIREVYDKVVEISGQVVGMVARDEARAERMDRIEKRQDEEARAVEKHQDVTNRRLTALERWRWSLAALTPIASAVVSIVVLTHH